MIDDINPEITTETTESDYPGQNTTETPPEEVVLTMKDDIVTRREEVKKQQLAERLQLPKIKKNAWVHDTIDIANKAINDIKVNAGRPLTLTDINQIVYL